MSARLRKLIGLFAILAFLLVYVGLAVRIAAYIPEHGVWRPLLLVGAGVCWGAPLLPLISWMNRGR